MQAGRGKPWCSDAFPREFPPIEFRSKRTPWNKRPMPNFTFFSPSNMGSYNTKPPNLWLFFLVYNHIQFLGGSEVSRPKNEMLRTQIPWSSSKFGPRIIGTVAPCVAAWMCRSMRWGVRGSGRCSSCWRMCTDPRARAAPWDTWNSAVVEVHLSRIKLR